MTPDEEQRTIRRCLDLLETGVRQRPQGWVSPVMAYTEHTREFLAAEKLLWHGDARDTDLPSVARPSAGPIVQIPISDFTDNRTLRSSPQDIWDVYKETFDYLYAPRAAGLPRAVDALPFRRPADDHGGLREDLQVYGADPDVWFASFGEIARWVMERQARADPRRLLKALRLRYAAVSLLSSPRRRGPYA